MTTTAPSIPAGTWQVDPAHSAVTFTARHMMVAKVRGRFTDFSADIVIADDPLQSTVNAIVQMASIATGDSGRDDHLRTNDFFDIENHPTMTFRSTGLEGTGDEYRLHGDLTIRGVTRPVELLAAVRPEDDDCVRVRVEGSIRRSDFGLEWDALRDARRLLVADEVRLSADVVLTRTQ